MTLNYACIFGRIKLVLYDDRPGSATAGTLQELFLGPDHYVLVDDRPRDLDGLQGHERSRTRSSPTAARTLTTRRERAGSIPSTTTFRMTGRCASTRPWRPNSTVAAGAALGKELHALVADLYPICRSITGDGVRETLRRIGELVPLEVHEVPTGTQAFDWTVPREWNIRDAYVKDARGVRVVDFQASNLHVVATARRSGHGCRWRS